MHRVPERDAVLRVWLGGLIIDSGRVLDRNLAFIEVDGENVANQKVDSKDPIDRAD
jgi:hypothetical protein